MLLQMLLVRRLLLDLVLLLLYLLLLWPGCRFCTIDCLLSLLLQFEICCKTVLDFLNLLLLPLRTSVTWSQNTCHQTFNVMRQARCRHWQVWVHRRMACVIGRRLRVAEIDWKSVDLVLGEVHVVAPSLLIWLSCDRVVHQLAQEVVFPLDRAMLHRSGRRRLIILCGLWRFFTARLDMVFIHRLGSLFVTRLKRLFSTRPYRLYDKRHFVLGIPGLHYEAMSLARNIFRQRRGLFILSFRVSGVTLVRIGPLRFLVFVCLKNSFLLHTTSLLCCVVANTFYVMCKSSHKFNHILKGLIVTKSCLHTLFDLRPLNPLTSLIASITSSGISFLLSFFEGRPLRFDFCGS